MPLLFVSFSSRATRSTCLLFSIMMALTLMLVAIALLAITRHVDAVPVVIVEAAAITFGTGEP